MRGGWGGEKGKRGPLPVGLCPPLRGGGGKVLKRESPSASDFVSVQEAPISIAFSSGLMISTANGTGSVRGT